MWPSVYMTSLILYTWRILSGRLNAAGMDSTAARPDTLVISPLGNAPELPRMRRDSWPWSFHLSLHLDRSASCVQTDPAVLARLLAAGPTSTRTRVVPIQTWVRYRICFDCSDCFDCFDCSIFRIVLIIFIFLIVLIVSIVWLFWLFWLFWLSRFFDCFWSFSLFFYCFIVSLVLIVLIFSIDLIVLFWDRIYPHSKVQ